MKQRGRGEWQMWSAGIRMVCALAMLVCCGAVAYANGEVPLMSELMKPADKDGSGEAGEEKDAFPVKLTVEQASLDLSDILPAGPAVYLETANGQQAAVAFSQTAIIKMQQSVKMQSFLKSNPFTLASLYGDLPATYSSADSLRLTEVGIGLGLKYLNVPARVALAVYGDRDEGMYTVFMADIGRDRKETFEALSAARDEFLSLNPAFLLDEAAHGDDYVDVLRTDDGKAELAIGIIRNFVVVSSSASFAEELKNNANGKGKDRFSVLNTSAAYRDIAVNTSGTAQVRGFVDLPVLLREMRSNNLPGASEVMDFACDMAGRGLVYYDASVEAGQWVEHIISPTTQSGSEAPGVPSRISQVCKPSDPRTPKDWQTARLIPYQPSFFIATQLHQTEIPAIIKGNPFGRSDFSLILALSVPETVRILITEQLKDVIHKAFLSEVSFALLGRSEEQQEWVFVFSVANTTEVMRILQAVNNKNKQEVGGVTVYAAKDDLDNSVNWAVLSQKNFENLGGSYLVVTSHGRLMQTLLDQATALSANLSINEDFIKQVRALGKEQSIVWYYNLPRKISYLDLAEVARSYFPRVKGVRQRPPTSFFRDHLNGIAGGVQVRTGEQTVRSTLVSPVGVVPSLAMMLGLDMPGWIRERARTNLSLSRSNLGRMWLEMQTYATQRGHFPGSLDELRRLLPEEDRARVFLSPAALEEVGKEEAMQRSYRYVAGLRTNDEPDWPVVYEAAPWHYEYQGMFSLGQPPAESGPYVRWRLVLQLDGTIRAYTEEQFRKKVYPRIRSRE